MLASRAADVAWVYNKRVVVVEEGEVDTEWALLAGTKS